MACRNCRDNFVVKATSNEISWQGDAVEDLDICVGDSLTWVGNIILEKIQDLLKGRGIILDDLTLSDCEYIEDLLGIQEKNLLNVLDVYKEAICQLKDDSTDVQETINNITDIENYTLGCLDPEDPCGDPLTFQTLIQSIIDKVCSLQTQFDNIAATMGDVIEEVAGNFIGGGAVTSAGGNGFTVTGTGEDTVLEFTALVPPNCPIIYRGSNTFFDINGVGLPNTPYEGWLICNGNNGTPTSTSLPQNGGNNIIYIIRFT